MTGMQSLMLRPALSFFLRILCVFLLPFFLKLYDLLFQSSVFHEKGNSSTSAAQKFQNSSYFIITLGLSGSFFRVQKGGFLC